MEIRRTAALALGCICLVGPLSASDLDSTLKAQQQNTRKLQQTQQQIEALDDQNQLLWGRYQQAVRQVRLLEPQVQEQQQQLDQLRAKRRALETDLASLDASRQGLAALEQQMWQRLQQFVQLDVPLQAQERAQRLARLERLVTDPASSQSQRLEQLWAAYQVELAYSRGLEAWQGPIPGLEDQSGTLLRLGRTALYYLTPDGSAGGIWQPTGWRMLDSEQLDQVRLGISVARQQEPPQLLALPLPLPMRSGESS